MRRLSEARDSIIVCNSRERGGIGGSRLAIERGNLAKNVAAASVAERKHSAFN